MTSTLFLGILNQAIGGVSGNIRADGIPRQMLLRWCTGNSGLGIVEVGWRRLLGYYGW